MLIGEEQIKAEGDKKNIVLCLKSWVKVGACNMTLKDRVKRSGKLSKFNDHFSRVSFNAFFQDLFEYLISFFLFLYPFFVIHCIQLIALNNFFDC